MRRPRAARVPTLREVAIPFRLPCLIRPSNGPRCVARGPLVALISIERLAITAMPAWRHKPEAPACGVIRMTFAAWVKTYG